MGKGRDVNDEKLTELLQARVGETLFRDAAKEAARKDQAIGTWLRKLVERELYGTVRLHETVSDR